MNSWPAKEYTVLRERCFGDLEGKPLHMMMDAIKVQSKQIGKLKKLSIFVLNDPNSTFFYSIF